MTTGNGSQNVLCAVGERGPDACSLGHTARACLAVRVIVASVDYGERVLLSGGLGF